MTVNHTETVRCKQTITTNIQLLAMDSRKSIYENKSMQKNSRKTRPKFLVWHYSALKHGVFRVTWPL